MTNIHFGSIVTGNPPANKSVPAKTPVKFSGNFLDGFTGGFRDTLEQQQQEVAERIEQSDSGLMKSLFGKSKEATGSVVSRTWNGVKRTLTKSLLRPRGWLELSTILLGGVGIVFPVKHFIEGFFGVKSIFIPRVASMMHGNPVTGNKTLVGKLRGNG